MIRTMLLTLTLLVIGCGSASTCATIVINATFSGGAQAADTLTITTSVDGTVTDTEPLAHNVGDTTETVDVTFSDGYPVGHDVTIGVTAAVGTSELASANVELPSIGKSCVTAALALTESSGDLGVPVDFAIGEDL